MLLFAVKCARCSKPREVTSVHVSVFHSCYLKEKKEKEITVSLRNPFWMKFGGQPLFTHWWQYVPEKIKVEEFKNLQKQDLRSKPSNTMTQIHRHSFSAQDKKRQKRNSSFKREPQTMLISRTDQRDRSVEKSFQLSPTVEMSWEQVPQNILPNASR